MTHLEEYNTLLLSWPLGERERHLMIERQTSRLIRKVYYCHFHDIIHIKVRN